MKVDASNFRLLKWSYQRDNWFDRNIRVVYQTKLFRRAPLFNSKLRSSNTVPSQLSHYALWMVFLDCLEVILIPNTEIGVKKFYGSGFGTHTVTIYICNTSLFISKKENYTSIVKTKYQTYLRPLISSSFKNSYYPNSRFRVSSIYVKR